MPSKFILKWVDIAKINILIDFFDLLALTKSWFFLVNSFLLFYFNAKFLITIANIKQMTITILLQKKKKLQNI